MRFYYTDVTLGSSLFGSGITVHGPSSVHTLQYVYLPDSSDGGSPQYTGYKFGYATAYGMVKQITEYRGMTVSDTATYPLDAVPVPPGTPSSRSHATSTSQTAIVVCTVARSTRW